MDGNRSVWSYGDNLWVFGGGNLWTQIKDSSGKVIITDSYHGVWGSPSDTEIVISQDGGKIYTTVDRVATATVGQPSNNYEIVGIPTVESMVLVNCSPNCSGKVYIYYNNNNNKYTDLTTWS